MNEPTDFVPDIIQKANESLAAARDLFRLGYYDHVTSRAYYAAFHGVTALLEVKGERSSSHARTIGEFNRLFVKGGAISADSGKKIRDLFEHRQRSEYAYRVSTTRDEAERDLQSADEVLAELIAYLEKAHGYEFK